MTVREWNRVYKLVTRYDAAQRERLLNRAYTMATRATAALTGGRCHECLAVNATITPVPGTSNAQHYMAMMQECSEHDADTLHHAVGVLWESIQRQVDYFPDGDSLTGLYLAREKVKALLASKS